MVVGDLISQEIEFRKGTLNERYNWRRSGLYTTIVYVRRSNESTTRNCYRFEGNMFIVGAARGPLLHYFYGWLDKTMTIVSIGNVTKKIILDQAIMSPITILAFFYPAGWLEGQSTKTINDELRDKIVKTYAVCV